MMRVDTLPTLPGSDDVMDGWMYDTEPGVPPPEAPPGCEPMLTIAVGEIARYRVRCVPPKASLEQVTTTVLAADGEPVIVAESGRPLGVVRPSDLIRALVVARQGEQLCASALMSSSLLCLRIDAPASRALELLTERGAQEIAIIDESGILAAVLTPTDVARALAGRVRRGSAA